MRLTSRVTSVSRTHIECGNGALRQIDHFLRSNRFDKVKIFILADSNTHNHCLPILHKEVSLLRSTTLLEIPAGESSKSLETAEALWAELLSQGADRSSLLINLGGGVISDLGGFVAAGYKRGISYINIPTSLIGQADAAIGGKTGVNLSHLKNQVGLFYAPAAVFIFPGFLETLPSTHLRSGLAEVVKCALIGNAVLWNRMAGQGAAGILRMPVSSPFWQDLIEKTVTCKTRIVRDDFREQRQRKRLNFGHTVGHALESFRNMNDAANLLHGDAVTVGMIAESFLSHKKCGLPVDKLTQISTFLHSLYPETLFSVAAISVLTDLMIHDKKNTGTTIRFSLIKQPGVPVINIGCTRDEISEALRFVLNG